MNLTPWLLFVHILGAIAAFGPGFALPLFGAAAGREPQHANFTVRTTYFIARRLIVPLALLQGITGLGLVLAESIDLLATRWLLIAIVLYAVALYISIGLNLPNARRVIELSTTPPAPGSGPSPELLARVGRARQYGMIILALVVLIVGLMVLKPAF